MYDAKKRHVRYLKNAGKEREQSNIRYHADADTINQIRRGKYNENIIENREKLRLRQQARRAKLKLSQNDTKGKKQAKK